MFCVSYFRCRHYTSFSLIGLVFFLYPCNAFSKMEPTKDIVQLVESLHKAWVIPCTHDLLIGARLGVFNTFNPSTWEAATGRSL